MDILSYTFSLKKSKAYTDEKISQISSGANIYWFTGGYLNPDTATFQYQFPMDIKAVMIGCKIFSEFATGTTQELVIIENGGSTTVEITGEKIMIFVNDDYILFEGYIDEEYSGDWTRSPIPFDTFKIFEMIPLTESTCINPAG